MSVAKTIRAWIEGLPLGQVFTPAQLLHLGSRAAVDQNLRRLKQARVVERIAWGVYVRPKTNRFVGSVKPEALVVVQAITAALHQTIQVHGAEAARLLGLSTQVPVQPVFETSGSPRRLNLGGLRVELRHVAPRKLMLAGSLAGLAVSALRYLGRAGITPEVIAAVRGRLPREELRKLEANPNAMPAWMAEALLHPGRLTGAHA